MNHSISSEAATHLPDTPARFLLLDAVTSHDACGLTAWRSFADAPRAVAASVSGDGTMAAHQNAATSKHANSARHGVEAGDAIMASHSNTAMPEHINSAWHAVEAMAQAGALHLRRISDFTMHAFLLGIADCHRADGGPLPLLRLPCGPCRIIVRQLALTPGMATCAITLYAPMLHAAPANGNGSAETPLLHAEMHFGRIPYGATYREDALAPRYKELFAWLTRSSNA